MRKFVVFSVAVVLISAVVFFVARRQESKVPPELKIKVAASFYIPAEFAQQIGGEKVNVISITPSGVEPHEYEPTPGEIADVYSAKLFIYQGGVFDAWAGRLRDDLVTRGVKVVSVMDSFGLKNADPHIWLDPDLARREAEIIRGALIEIDPVNAFLYQKNSVDYLNVISLLDEEYKKGLAHCAKKDFVVSHSAFGRLARRYGLFPHSIVGASSEEEPSPGRIAEIIKLARAKGIKHIFTEPLVSSRAVETIARETGAEILTLNPIEGLTEKDAAEGKNYISLMRENLGNLRLALGCN